MNKDSHLIFEAYKNKLVSEDMPYPTFAKLSKHASPKSSREKSASEFRQQMPDSKEEYSAHDYAREMEAKGEGEEQGEHPYHGPLTDLGDGYYWAAEDEQDTDDQWYNFFLLKKTGAERNHYKYIRSFIKIRDYDDDLVSDDSGRIKAWLKKNNIIDISSEDEEGDLMKHMKDKGMIDKKATDDTGKYGRTREEEEHCASEDEQRRLDPKCWKGYHKAGTKLKSGVRVNNCVKN
jgi:hypothetical protein